MNSWLFLLSFLILTVKGQQSFLGRCPAVKIVGNFRPMDYLGKWFEYKKYCATFEAGGTCITARYTGEGNNVIGVHNRQYNPLLGIYSTIVGKARRASANTKNGKLIVKFPTAGIFGAEGKYWVLGTDYLSYSVVFSCDDHILTNTQYAWVLTRNRTPSAATIKAADDILTSNGISLRYFTLTTQSNCP